MAHEMNEIEGFFKETYDTLVNNGIKIKTKWNEYMINSEIDATFAEFAKVTWISGKDEPLYYSHFCLQEQYKVNKYRTDFIISGNINHIGYSMAVEIDGHDWHEKTKAQAIRDKKRERDILKENINMIRFSASEVYSNPKYCIKESITCYLSIYEAITIAIEEG